METTKEQVKDIFKDLNIDPQVASDLCDKLSTDVQNVITNFLEHCKGKNLYRELVCSIIAKELISGAYVTTSAFLKGKDIDKEFAKMVAATMFCMKSITESATDDGTQEDAGGHNGFTAQDKQYRREGSAKYCTRKSGYEMIK